MPTKKRVDPVSLVDTNVLLDATDTKRPRHAAAKHLLERHTGLVSSAQVMREYLVVASRPVALNGLGLSLPDAMSNLSEFRRIARLLPEEKPLLPTLLKLLRSHVCQGNTIHDALLVATMWVHKVPKLITSNRRHFERFEDLIEIVDLPVSPA